MTLDTSDETEAALKSEAAKLEAEAAREEGSGGEKHSGARYRAIKATVLQALHRIQRDREEKRPTDGALAENVIPRLLRVLDAFPEARAAVLAELAPAEERESQ